MNQQYIIIALAILTISLFVWNSFLTISQKKLAKNQKVLFAGSEGKDLEQIILKNKQNIESLDKDIKDLYEITNKIHSLAHKGLHNVGLVRFNPFRDLGGDQSFAIALLDGEKNGLVLSSLYSRDGVRVYAKAIIGGESIKYPLSEEERTAIANASVSKLNQKQSKIL